MGGVMSNDTEIEEDRAFVKLARNVLDVLVRRWKEEGNTTHFFESGSPDAIEMKSFFEVISEAESFFGSWRTDSQYVARVCFAR